MPLPLPTFSEFHGTSAFSFLRGASQPETLVHRAAELGYRSLALPDVGGFYGSARAHAAAKEVAIRAIVASSLKLPDGAFVPVLCATRRGYQILSRHLTDVHLGTPQRAALGTGDLIALTGDREGPVVRHLLRDDKDSALASATSLVGTFGPGNVFVELNRHGLRDDSRLNRHLIDLAGYLKLPLGACNAPLHATRADRMLADAFSCLRHHVSLDAAGHLLEPNGERHLKSPRQMVELFADIPEAIDNGRRLEKRIDFTLENLGYRFPDYPDGRGNPLSIAEQQTMLRRFTYEGSGSRYAPNLVPRRVKTQLEHELALIGRLGFAGYFLIVREIIEFARGRGILCQGRGSAANSAVCFCLGITAFDPVASGLLFERFLSENRESWPDIDIDFPSGDHREAVIQHVFRKYGERGAAMTANVITYRPKSAFREMSKVLGFPPATADRFSQGSAHGSDEFGDREPEPECEFEARVSALLPPSHPRLPALSRLYHAVLGMPRHLGQHSGGMIVCDRGLDAVVPLQRATMPGRTVVQWDKDDCEDLGIVKIDLLGLGMLAAMEDAIAICSSRGRPVDLAKIPHDDEAVYDLMCRTDTVGTFQVESRAQMATLPILRPRCFYDVAVEVAIIRPGPIVGEMRHPYLNRRTGIESVDHIHPLCEPILKRTLGVILFQEQILRIAMDVAGFSGAEADELRRTMGSKRSQEKMGRVVEKLRRGMAERGVDEVAQDRIVQSIGAFALYGFPESHAISFALIAYASCYLKVHHAAEFYTGLLNNQPMGFYSVNSLIQDGKRRGIRFLPVSVVHSEDRTTVVSNDSVRLGLLRIKGLGRETAVRIATERCRRPFTSLADFLDRCQPNQKERRLLAKAGALNQLPSVGHRRAGLWQVELPLYRDLLPPEPREDVLPAMAMAERLAADYTTQSASAGPHPVRLWREQHPELKLPRSVDLIRLPHGFPVSIAGMVICRQRPGTAKGHCFISLEDETGIANLFVPKTTFHTYRLVITAESFLLAEGRVQIGEGDQATVYVTSIRPMPGSDAALTGGSHDFH
ncbi:error-prone DNA polymerase [Luteolibacter arcticus]|uniref:Error-prone DNA polymerase n=1 Tax=Luteolibacter arcticus TaxID=1581411 RepID=A0ABT3GQ69_9BACT|nr:error-prone DNA polymerase [Luteolibacter arcticus]MCW1925681.1 error-prone DNA polymerase [Luteolibacter arcticus]